MALKKIGSALLLIGGLVALIGAIGALGASMAMKTEEDIQTIIKMSVLARVGSIAAFVSSLIAIAGSVLGKYGKGSSVVGAVFAASAFIGQFIINPFTSEDAAMEAAFSANSESIAATAGMGLLVITMAGFACFIVGIVGLAIKKK